MMATALPLATPENPLGLKPNNEGATPFLTINQLEGNACEPRIRFCTAFVEFINREDGYIRAFSALNEFQQVLVVLIREVYDKRPHCIKEHFLKTTADLQKLAVS